MAANIQVRRAVDAKLLERAEKAQRSVKAFLDQSRGTIDKTPLRVSESTLKGMAEAEAKRAVDAGQGAITLSVADLTPAMSRLASDLPSQYSNWKAEADRQAAAIETVARDVETELELLENRDLPDLDVSESHQLVSAQSQFEESTPYVQNREEHSVQRDRFERLRTLNNTEFPKSRNAGVYWTVLFVLGFGDMVINYNVLLAKFELAIAIFLTLIIAFIVAVTSHIHGRDFKQRKLLFQLEVDAVDRKNKKRELVVVTTFFFACLVFIFWARYSYFAQGAGLDLSSDGLLSFQFILSRIAPTIFFNLAVWFTGAVISFFFHERVPGLREAHKRYKQLNAELDDLKVEVVNRKTEITRTFLTEKLALQARETECRNQLVNLNAWTEQLSKLNQNYKSQINAKAAVILKQYAGFLCNKIATLEKDSFAIVFVSPRRGKLSLLDFEASDFSLPT